MNDNKLDAILRKVQALIALADHPKTPTAEAELARTKAEALMFEYRITELGTPEQKANIVPKWRTIFAAPISTQYYQVYRYLLGACLQHVDAMATTTRGTEIRDGEPWYIVDACGYDSDLRYAEMLFTAFSLAFASKMEPRVNPAKSDAENAYIMRSAGWEGGRIAQALWGINDKSHRSKARRLFAQWATSIGEDPAPLLGHSNRVSDFRASYEQAFQYEAASRLRRMRQSHGDGAIELASRKEAVKEAFYGKYPNLRPAPAAATAIGPSGGPGGNCARCKKASSGYCREHNWMKPRKIQYREYRHSAAGAERGRIAAQSVDLGGKANEIGEN